MNRLNLLFSIFNSINIYPNEDNANGTDEDFDIAVSGHSIYEISNSFQIPIELLRKDLCGIISSPFFRSVLFINDSPVPDDKAHYAELFEGVSSGIHDKSRIALTFERNLNNYADNIFVFMDEEEKNILQSNYEEIFFDAFSAKKYSIKSLSPTLSRKTSGKIIQLQETISDSDTNNWIEFTLSGSTHKYRIQVKEILYNPIEGTYYCCDRRNRPYKIEKMENIQSFINTATDTVEKVPNNYIEYSWNGLPDESAPFDVKIKFQYLNANLENRIKNETRHRKYGNIVISEDHSYCIYTDKVTSIDSFRRWLRGFGASAIVLEPASLAKKMEESIDKMLSQYKSGDFI